MPVYKRLLPYLRPHFWRMAITIVANLIAALLDGFAIALLIPFLNILFHQPATAMKSGWISKLLDATVGSRIVPGDEMHSLRNVIMLVLAAVILKNLLVWVAGQFGATLQEFVTRDLRNAVYRHLAHLPLSYFTQMKAGQILSRVINDTFETRLILTQIVTQSLQSASLVLVYIAILFSISWQLSLIAMVILPLLGFSLQPMLKKLRRGNLRRGNVHGEMTSVLQETISGIRLVKASGTEAYEESRFAEGSNKYASSSLRLTRLALLAPPVTEIIGTVIAVLILWIGAWQVLRTGSMTGATLLAFLTLVLRLLQPLKQLSQMRTTAQSSLASAERLFEILDSPAEFQRDRGTRDIASFDRHLEFENVSFSYGDAPVLSHIDFSASKGEVVALVGPSGSGKSTLVDLIPRFYEPTEGRILIDGIDIRDIKLPALRSLTGIVSQETVLFHDSVRSNIAYGATDHYTQEEIEAAAKAANAHEFIVELPRGYDTLLGERGTRLSGGQRQRLAIARALLTDPPILILDEATSALDTESERLVQEAVDRLLQGRTVFVIAHRLSTITHADQILVLDRGEIVERGTHAELLARRGAYHRLYSLQFGDADEASMVPSAG
ncbi:MAG TPA: ABC transporter transmembrane domain-containing protein [Gemmatimonadaceae bacterium]|jgi:subfamily B ATP-binding cassette protein MsbA|nr:ABC transporter transmembrane domain-containing protein [Gemmatimonadaceae bacterium]